MREGETVGKAEVVSVQDGKRGGGVEGGELVEAVGGGWEGGRVIGGGGGAVVERERGEAERLEPLGVGGANELAERERRGGGGGGAFSLVGGGESGESISVSSS